MKEKASDLTDGEALAFELSCQRAYEMARRARGDQRAMGNDDATAATAAYLKGLYEDG